VRGIRAPERDIEGFKEDAINAKNYETMLAKAIGWEAPVRFIKDGKPWFSRGLAKAHSMATDQAKGLFVGRELYAPRWVYRT
jgi:hypothetical protein